MRNVLCLAACLALTVSVASANMPAFTPDLSNLSKDAAKMDTPASIIVPVVAGRVKELSYKVNFVHRNGAVTATVAIGGRDFLDIKRLGGHVTVKLYVEDGLHQPRLLRTVKMVYDDKKAFQLLATEACDHHSRAGRYTRLLKVRASAHARNGIPLSGYTSDPMGKTIRVSCLKSRWEGLSVFHMNPLD